jgi:hypothetical protein
MDIGCNRISGNVSAGNSLDLDRGPDAESVPNWWHDDVPVLMQNLYLVGLDETWPDRWYDMQRIFLQAYPRREGEGLTLESVVDRLGIPK